jgi:uncharacterized protein
MDGMSSLPNSRPAPAPADIPALLDAIRRQFPLDWHGAHGIRHWERVRDNGLRLAADTGANPKVVELFAYLHDSRRLDEWEDDGHGARAAEFLRTLQGRFFHLDDVELELLSHACRHHSEGIMDGDVTVLTCWDADRLDLGRVGIEPNPRYLCTAAARRPEVLAWAYRRSVRRRGS